RASRIVYSVRAAGCAPLSDQVTVPCAPVCENCSLNGAFTVPVAFAGFVTVMVWQLMVRFYGVPPPWQPFASVAVTVIGKLPVTVGVPERMPVEVSKERPAGGAPLSRQRTVPCAPLCVNCSLNAASPVPVALAGLVTVMTWQPIDRLYVVLVPVQPLLSGTSTVIGKLPGAVGVPEGTPAVESARPRGRE